MFVKCSKRVKFTHPENPKVTWEMPAGFIGDVPVWVENDWYFGACCKDGTITVVKSTSDRDIQNATENTPSGAEGDSANLSADGGQGAEGDNGDTPDETPKETGGRKKK